MRRKGSGATGRRRWADTRWWVIVVRISVLLFLLGLWEFYGHRVSRALFAPPSAVLRDGWDLTISGVLPKAFLEMNIPLFLGFGSAVIIGCLVGIIMGRRPRIKKFINPYVSFLYSLPHIALIPLFILWFGIGVVLTTILVFTTAVIPVIINACAGVEQIDDKYWDTARVAGASNLQEIRTVMLPGALPYILTGVQSALSQAVVSVVAAEMTAELAGLGGLVLTFANYFQTSKMIAPIMVIAVESIAIIALMRLLRRKLAPWSTGITA